MNPAKYKYYNLNNNNERINYTLNKCKIIVCIYKCADLLEPLNERHYIADLKPSRITF